MDADHRTLAPKVAPITASRRHGRKGQTRHDEERLQGLLLTVKVRGQPHQGRSERYDQQAWTS